MSPATLQDEGVEEFVSTLYPFRFVPFVPVSHSGFYNLPNHAPYAFKHWYWAGLLLLVRVVVYIISAADVSSDRTITLLAIGSIVYFLTIFVCGFQPHKSWSVLALEVICYANIMRFCLATVYVSKVRKSQDTIAYISRTISLVLFLTVLSYHVMPWFGKNWKTN